MTRPVDPALARKLADRIERLPDLINDPLRMPFVQDTLRVALEQYRSDREAQALGREIMGDPGKTEEYREPVAFVQLLDAEKQAIEKGFKQDEAGVFEEIERDAAEIGEWLKDCRHPRDAERFREFLKFVCGEALVMPAIGVEVRPGVYKLDLDSWRDEAAKPLCNYLRELADEMATEVPRTPEEETSFVVLDEDKDGADAGKADAKLSGQPVHRKDLHLDEVGHSVSMGTKHEDFGSKRYHWKLFVALAGRCGSYYETETLIDGTRSIDDAEIERSTFYGYISEINSLIKPLGIRANSQRFRGYRLEYL